jgi:hypothetical protein
MVSSSPSVAKFAMRVIERILSISATVREGGLISFPELELDILFKESRCCTLNKYMILRVATLSAILEVIIIKFVLRHQNPKYR